MIKDNQRIFNNLHVVLDVLITAIAYLLSWWLKFRSGLLEYEWGLSSRTYFSALYVILPTYLLLYYFFDLYQSKRASGRKRELFNIIKANTVGLIGFMVVLYLINQAHFSRQVIIIFWFINICALTVERNVIRYLLRFFRKKGYNIKYVLLVGYSKSAEMYINRIRLNPQWGYQIRGILDDHVEAGTMYKGIKVLGTIANLEYILPQNKLDEIAITLSLSEYGQLEHIVDLCEKSGVHTKFIPDYSGIIPDKPYTEDIQGLPVINIRAVPLTNTFNIIAKRMVDIAAALFGIVLFSPIMLISVIAIKCTSRGPIIFKQERVGLHNRPFKLYKFRTMYLKEDLDENLENKAWTTKDDPRVTKVGRFLRRTSIDELPQFFNILFGQMSLVGPRPEQTAFVEKFKEEIPRYMIKHQVRPGLTGWAQVNGFRGDTSIEKRIEYDLYYIENWTMGFDIRIMFMTIFKGFINPNAY
ncbi:MAG: undecaprenyl-phosphate glucose phosphotransferase [Lachnospiraceae bacterium]|nr:undecaprenyl-phosphate glucose phosphotransferase [Lachnospiraceae bacterium]